MNEIITSLFIYKSQLYASYLDGQIKQKNINTAYNNVGIEFKLDNIFKDTIILDIKAYKDKLYILTVDGLYKYYNTYIEKIKEINDAQVITIDKKLKILFIVSDSRGLVGINLKNDRYIDDIKLNLNNIENNQISITSIVANNGVIFISILNKGIIRVDYRERKSEFKYKKMEKIELKTPQDIYYNEKGDELAVVDYKYGLILINIKNGQTNNYNLPNNDIPNTIKMIKIFDRKYYIIEANNALYRFNTRDKEFTKLFDGSVSNLTTYYNKIYFIYDRKLEIKKL